jgi:hypothetical protein
MTDASTSLVPEGFILGGESSCNKSKLTDLVQNLLQFWRTLKKLSLSFHFQKAVDLTKDLRGSLEKISGQQHEFRILSLFYQKWKQKFCKRWILKLVSNFRSLKICKKYFSASRAWKKLDWKQDMNDEKTKIQLLRAENFYKNRVKVRSFFVWSEVVGKVRSVRKIFKFCERFLVLDSVLIWKHLSVACEKKCSGLGDDEIDLDWKKFEEFKGWGKGKEKKGLEKDSGHQGVKIKGVHDGEVKNKGFGQDRSKNSRSDIIHDLINTENAKTDQNEQDIQGKTLKKEVRFQDETNQMKQMDSKKGKGNKFRKNHEKSKVEKRKKVQKPCLKTEKTFDLPSENLNSEEISTKELILKDNESEDDDKSVLAERYHRVLLLKKSMCGFIVIFNQNSLKLYYKSLKSKKFLQIKSRKILKKSFESLLSYTLLSRR